MTEDMDRAPDAGPWVIQIFWTVGDSLEVNCGGLQSWEAVAILEQAADAIREEERAEAEAEGEDAEP